MAITHELVAADWQIERDTGAITYVGNDHDGASPSYATVIEFHRWLQELADDAYATASSNDEVDITELNPSARSTDNIITLLNGYYIDDTAAEHLYDGSIIQLGGDTIYDGIVNFGNAGVVIQIQQNGAVIADDWWNYQYGGTSDSGSGTTMVDAAQSWDTDELVGYWIFNTDDGSRALITANTSTTITFTDGLEGGTLNTFGTDAYSIGRGLNEALTQGISHRFMVKVREDGVDINHRKIIGTTRGWHKDFNEFVINATARGNNVLALSDSTDINNPDTIGTVAGWSSATPTEGLREIDVDNNGATEQFYVEWTKGTKTINEMMQRMKYYTFDRTPQTLGGVSGEIFRGITHNFAFDGETGGITVTTNDNLVWGTLIDTTSATGSYTVGEAVEEDVTTPTWAGRVIAMDAPNSLVLVDIEYGTPEAGDAMHNVADTVTDADIGTVTLPIGTSSGGEFLVLAIDNDLDNIYGQLLKGTAPVDNTVLYDDADLTDYLSVAGTPTERTIAAPFFGASTGSAIIGTYGVGVSYSDLTNSDLLTALDGQTYQPPNNVTNTVSGVIHDEDYILVAEWSGAYDENGDPEINKDQLSLDTALITDNITTVEVTGAIPGNTPNTGYIRVVDNNGYDRRLHYTAWENDVTNNFTIDTTDGQEDFLSVNASATNDVYITYIDQLASGAEITDAALAYTIGTQYKIVTVGDSDFTTMGASANTIGVIFTATDTDAGGTTGVLAEYVTSESYTGVYSTPQDLVVIVRDGGGTLKGSTPIKQFISSWSFSGSNGSITAIRTSDT